MGPAWAKVQISDPYRSFLGLCPDSAHMGPILPCLLGSALTHLAMDVRDTYFNQTLKNSISPESLANISFHYSRQFEYWYDRHAYQTGYI